MVKTLITGGTGFVGSAIAQKLISKRESVQVLTRDPSNVPRSRRVPGVFYVKGDVFDPSSLEAAMVGCDAVINAVQFENAPFEDARKGATYARVDGEGTERQIEAAKKTQVKRFIYISGAGTREGRTETWFRAKLRAELAVKNSDLTWTAFRPSWIFGSEDRSLNKFATFARFLPFVPIIGSGNEKIQPIFVEDVSEIVWRALNDARTHGKIFDVGGPETLTMREIVKTMLRVQGKRRLVIAHPKSLMKAIASIVQWLPGRPLTPDGIDFITMEENVDNGPLLAAINIQLTPLYDGLLSYMGERVASPIEPFEQRVAA